MRRCKISSTVHYFTVRHLLVALSLLQISMGSEVVYLLIETCHGFALDWSRVAIGCLLRIELVLTICIVFEVDILSRIFSCNYLFKLLICNAIQPSICRISEIINCLFALEHQSNRWRFRCFWRYIPTLSILDHSRLFLSFLECLLSRDSLQIDS